MTFYKIAFSNTEYNINKYYCDKHSILYNYQTVRFSPYLDNQYNYKFYVPETTNILSFNVLLNEPSGITQYLLFVLRYATETSTNYSIWSFIENPCTISYISNMYQYTFPYSISYEYSGPIYSFPESSVIRDMNPFNVGGLELCKEQDYKIQLKESDVLEKFDVFHMKKYKSDIGLEGAGDWMYIHIVAGKNFAREMLVNMYFD